VEEVIRTDRDVFPTSISPDGSHLLVFGPGESSASDLSVVSLAGNADIRTYRQTEFSEAVGSFSPDGRWVVYHSDESGSIEVYVAPFPGPGRRWQVSTNGGVYAKWRSDGQEIVYSQFDGDISAVAVRAAGDSFHVDGESTLFTIGQPQIGGPHYSMSGDGQRFLVVPPTIQRADSLMHLLVNWPTALEARR
jgi:dipeptidyl aminopeptidase/acylaminoacyl peptidase